jgi:succinate dehydrogenase/fumarate reductase flavoprotein subunit
MTSERVEDCVIVGGGWAGMVAARRLQQLGLAPLVLEKGEVEGGGGSARISGGLLHIAWQALDAPADAKYAGMLAETDGEIDTAVARAVAERSARLVPWLLGEGVEMRPKSEAPYARWALWPHRPNMGMTLTDEFGPDRALLALYANFRRADGRVRLGTRGVALQRESGGRWRVHWQDREGDEGSVLTATVVFADGGFQANPELLTRYVGPNAALCLRRAMPSGTGDALTMLLAAGASLVGLGRVYGHMLSIDALHSDELWPFPSMDELCLSGLMIDRGGRRFAVGREKVEGLVTRLARTDDPRGYTAIFDDALWHDAGRRSPFGMAVPNPELVARGGHFVTADDLEALARALDVATDALLRAVDEHHEAGAAARIAQAPFHAARVVPGITFTMGGPRITSGAEVVDHDGRPLPGLFAAGSTAGGVHGGPRGGYVGGLGVAATLGYVAAETLAGRLVRA